MSKVIPTTSQWSVLRANAPLTIFYLSLATTITGLVGLVRWYLTGDIETVAAFFRYPNAFFTLLFTGAEAGFTLYASRQFGSKDVFRRVWKLLSAAAVAHFIGRLLAVVSIGDRLPGWNPLLSQAGQVIGGPVQMCLLLLAMANAVWSFRQLAVYRPLKRIDFVLLAIVCALTMRTMLGIHQFLAGTGHATWDRVLLWASDPLLMLLLAVAIVIRRSIADTHGMLANCWRAYIAAIVLMSIGDASLWCASCSNFELWNSLGWYIWLIADAAFALAPAFQVAAIERVQMRTRLFRQIALAR